MAGTTPNEHGTWTSGRGGWCNGRGVAPWVVDVTADLAPPGQPNTLEYRGLFNGSDPLPSQSGGDIMMQASCGRGCALSRCRPCLSAQRWLRRCPARAAACRTPAEQPGGVGGVTSGAGQAAARCVQPGCACMLCAVATAGVGVTATKKCQQRRPVQVGYGTSAGQARRAGSKGGGPGAGGAAPDCTPRGPQRRAVGTLGRAAPSPAAPYWRSVRRMASARRRAVGR